MCYEVIIAVKQKVITIYQLSCFTKAKLFFLCFRSSPEQIIVFTLATLSFHDPNCHMPLQSCHISFWAQLTCSCFDFKIYSKGKSSWFHCEHLVRTTVKNSGSLSNVSPCEKNKTKLISHISQISLAKQFIAINWCQQTYPEHPLSRALLGNVLLKVENTCPWAAYRSLENKTSKGHK